MRGGLLRSWSGVAVVSLLSACSTIIGVSDYEIDPQLDDSGSGGKATRGGNSTGGKDVVGDGGEPSGGDDVGGTGAMPMGGKGTMPMGGKSTGGTAVGGESTGGTTPVGDGGMGGEPVVGCQSAAECDDTIDCTTDTCNSKHECVHTAKDTLCDASLCETCQAGIGCVAGDKTTMQLLLDPNFDDDTGDWDETSDTFGQNIFTDAAAQSGGKIAKFGPAAGGATEQEYGDLLQWIEIPAKTVALNLTGYYKLTPGTKLIGQDYVALAFYEDGGTKPVAQFHSFEGSSGAQAAWKAFSYNIVKADLTPMVGNEYSFDLVANVWGSVYNFDSLQLTATVCK